MNSTRKSIKVGDKDVFDPSLIYSRVLGLQQSWDINLKHVLKHELSPISTSMFQETANMRIAVGKSSLKHKLKVTMSARLTQDCDVVIMDGCAIMWTVHWPHNGSVKDFVDNFCNFVIQRISNAHVYLVFDRYYDFSIKSSTRMQRSGQYCTRRHHLSINSLLPAQKVMLTVTENKRQLIGFICSELVRLGLSSHSFQHSLIVTGQERTPIELTNRVKLERDDMSTTHEEADVIMVQQAIKLAKSGVKSICVLSDDTDVFVLLIHFYYQENLSCQLVMESTGKERALVDIEATVKAHTNVVPHLLAMHCISGCDTMAQFFGVGKGTALRAINAGFHLNSLGDLKRSLTEVYFEATRFIGKCYGVNVEGVSTEMSDIRVKVWSHKMTLKKVTAAPDLKALPPTTQAFKENVKRAHIQAAIWKSALTASPPPVDVTEYGWSRDEASSTLKPVSLPPGVAVAPPSVLELIRCGCASKEPCKSAKCGCEAAHLPCTFFCSCNSDNVCLNPFNKQAELDDDDGPSQMS